MKKYLYGLVVIVSLAIITMLPAQGYARWVLYDDFEEDEINTELWDVIERTATISIENGKAKFIHNSTQPNVANWLAFKNPDQIKAVRVTVRVDSDPCGDVRSRIGGAAWEDNEGNYLWQIIQIRDQYERIEGWIGAYTLGDALAYTLFYPQFRYPIDIKGKDFTIEIYFGKRMIEFKVLGLGSTIFIPQQRLFRYDAPFKGIGTRNGFFENCDFTVYFDDVYVIYKRFWK